MTVDEANKKVLRITEKLQDAQLMLIELKGEKTSKLKKYGQYSIDTLIDNINSEFLQPAIDSIIREF